LAADEGDLFIKCNYAERLRLGNDVPQNGDEAARYFELAADECDSFFKLNYAQYRFSGEGIAQDLDEAARYFKMAEEEMLTDAGSRSQ
jgi:TPR repeat protein